MFEYDKSFGDLPFVFSIGYKTLLFSEESLNELKESIAKVEKIHAVHLSARDKLSPKELEITGL